MTQLLSRRYKLLLIVLTSIILSSTLKAEEETGSSHNLFYLNKLDDNSYFVGRANLVTRDGFSEIFFGYVDANYRYQMTEHWLIEAGYRQAYLKLKSGWREEYRPMLSLYWRGKLAGGHFSNRHRIEWRSFEGKAKDRERYRNESVWISQQTLSDYQLIPFIEEELFYDITDDEFNANWVTVGISKYWTRSKKGGVKWKLGYRLQSQKSNDEWENRHVLVTGISITSFD